MKSPASNQHKHLCSNCLTTVQGAFCAHCGQKQQAVLRNFRQVVGEFFTDVLNFDSKLLGTLKPLLFQPGMLSEEYFANRRMRYVSPIKLYFLLSIVAFFFIQQSIDGAVQFEGAPQVSVENDKAVGKQQLTIGNFNGKPWDAKSNPIAIHWLPDAGNDFLNVRLTRLEKVVKEKDWRQLLHTGLTATPQALLILLPYFALLLKVVYLFRRRFYMEHLIVALHNHAFLLFAISIGIMLSVMTRWVAASWWQEIIRLLGGLVALWVPIYFLIGLKRIYQQSWKMTFFKFCLLGFCYLNLLAFGLVINIVIGIFML